MDESVRRAMGKWPDVPAVFGWLKLDRTGRWLLRGEPVTHPGLIEFINRNYGCDERGRWFFQNGPQRGYVELEYTPWVLHADTSGQLRTHTGQTVARLHEACVDDDDHLLLGTEAGVGLVEADSVSAVAEWLRDERGEVLEAETFGQALERLRAGERTDVHLRYAGESAPLTFVPRGEVPDRFGFVADPQSQD